MKHNEQHGDRLDKVYYGNLPKKHKEAWEWQWYYKDMHIGMFVLSSEFITEVEIKESGEICWTKFEPSKRLRK